MEGLLPFHINNLMIYPHEQIECILSCKRKLTIKKLTFIRNAKSDVLDLFLDSFFQSNGQKKKMESKKKERKKSNISTIKC